ncbi:MAG: two-component regulator propeller domain-containing protein [Bacteroidales bacterium]
MRHLIIFLFIFFWSFSLNAKQFYFRHYRNEDGLSNNTVMVSIQDRRGFIWFGTKEGLNRFDGYQFKTYLNNPNNPNSLINNIIISLCEDKDGIIWIGTINGICYFNPDNDYFGTIQNEDIKITGLILDIKNDFSNNIWITTRQGVYRYNKLENNIFFYSATDYFQPGSICVTLSGDIWIASSNGNIYKYDPRTNSYIKYKVLNDNELLSSTQLVKIVETEDNELLVSTDNAGLRQFNPSTGKVVTLFDKDNEGKDIIILAILKKSENEYWIGSESGIHIFDLKEGFRGTIQKSTTNPFSITNNSIRSIIKDREGGIWIGTFYGGINYLPQDNKPFEKFYPTSLPGSLTGNVVREICVDSYGNIWVGTEDAGLNKFNPRNGIFTGFTPASSSKRVPSTNIQGLMVDGNNLWIGTYDKGIFILNIQSEKIIKHFELRLDNIGLKTNSIITFLKTKDGTIYVGSATGLYQFNRETETFTYLNNVASGCWVHSLHENNNGTIWIGTYGNGLLKYDRFSNTTKRFSYIRNDPYSLNSDYITSIYEDNHNQIWITTEGNGFCLLDSKTEKFTRFVPGKELKWGIYCSILEDGNGILWITSTRGLLSFDPSTKRIIMYTKDDGLLDNHFSYNSAYLDNTGTMYFGTVSGLIAFNPIKIRENTYNTSVYITGFQVAGSEFLTNPTNSESAKSILETNKISLAYNKSSFSIDFVAPSFTNPKMTKYKYILEGSDKNWVLLPNNRKVYYTNLAPGDYRFKVMASIGDNLWSEKGAFLEIKIFPPIWLSVPVYLIYLVIFLSVVIFTIHFFAKRNRLEHQRKIDRLESEKEMEILNAKISFFTNITHEIRTPLTLIKGPLERIFQSGINSDTIEENLSIINKNTDRLLELTNQLLDFRKAEKEIFKLNFVHTDICELIESTFNLFLPGSLEKNISFQMHSQVKQYPLAVDRETLIKIISNLLSNALKFADTSVDLYLEPDTPDNRSLRIRVNSDGRLIPPDYSEKIFEPFFQLTPEQSGKSRKGTGLGLALARSLAELHQGKLFLDKEVNHLNSFVLELPKTQEESFVLNQNLPENGLKEERHEYEIFGNMNCSRPNILLVEDEKEMGIFISKELSHEYNIILASNGAEAIKVLSNYVINLVVSDVIMPVMDGYELCSQIKNNIEFSHIPLILLTATINLNARIEGLDAGADAYIEKPFSTNLLLAQISNLLKNRDLERQNFLESPLAHIKTLTMNKTDEEFMKKLHSNIMTKMTEPDFHIETIANMMGISISTLYRKVKALTDLNTVEYIRFYKLKKAAKLLSQGEYRIDEISYLVGFSSPSYFATSFHKQFGISPSEFLKQTKNNQ